MLAGWMGSKPIWQARVGVANWPVAFVLQHTGSQSPGLAFCFSIVPGFCADRDPPDVGSRRRELPTTRLPPIRVLGEQRGVHTCDNVTKMGAGPETVSRRRAYSYHSVSIGFNSEALRKG